MNNNYEKELEFIKNAARGSGKVNKNADNFMDGFNKQDIQRRLRELGMGNIADKLEPMSSQMIENMRRSNPQILKKAMEIFNDRR